MAQHVYQKHHNAFSVSGYNIVRVNGVLKCPIGTCVEEFGNTSTCRKHVGLHANGSKLISNLSEFQRGVIPWLNNLSVYFCVTHKVCLLPLNYDYHIQKYHKFEKNEISALKCVVQETIAPEILRPEGVVNQLSFLQNFRKYECEICGKYYQSASSFAQHCRGQCEFSECPDRAKMVQRLTEKSPYFEVTSSIDEAGMTVSLPVGNSDVLSLIEDAESIISHEKVGLRRVVERDRQTKFMSMTQWPKLLGSAEKKDIEARVGNYKEAWQKRISKLCSLIYEKFGEEGDFFPTMEIRCWMKSLELQRKGGSVMKSVKPASTSTYADICSKYMIFLCIMKDEGVELDVPIQQIEDFKNSADSCEEVTDQHLESFWAIIKCALATKITQGYEKSSLLVYIAHLGYNLIEDRFYDPSEFSHRATKLLYMLRLAVISTAWQNADMNVHDKLKQLRDTYLVKENDLVGGHIGVLTAYCKAAALEKNGHAAVIISNDFNEFTFAGATRSQHELVSWLKSEKADLLKILKEDLLFGKVDLIDVNTASSKNCVYNNKSRNYSVCELFHDDYGMHIVRAVTSSDELRDEFCKDNNWIRARLLAYEAVCQKWLKLLLTIVLVESGQPSRITEVIDMKWRNGDTFLRNILFREGQIMWVSGHSKTSSKNTILRFSTPMTSACIITYLCMVQPFRALISKKCGFQPLSDYVFSSLDSAMYWSADKGRSAFFASTKRNFAVPFGVRGYRQWACCIAQEILLPKYKTKLLAWDNADEDNDEEEEEDDDDGAKALFAQAGHSSRIAHQCYGRGTTFSSRFTDVMTRQYAEVSQLWQQYMQVYCEVNYQSPVKGIEKRISPDIAIKSLNMTWKSVRQKCAAELIYENEKTLLKFVILPTGSGKSLLYQLCPIVCRHKLCIVVVPLVALMADAKIRAKALKLNCKTWHEMDVTDYNCELLLVSSETFLSDQFFNEFMAVNSDNISKIFFDEAHLLQHALGYREIFTRLSIIKHWKIPLVLITATCPPTMVREITELLGMGEPGIYRCENRRSDIRYIIKRSKKGKKHTEIMNRLDKEVKGRIVVYCRSRKESEELAQVLNCSFYNGNMNLEEKKQVFDEWRCADVSDCVKVICATTGLGAGVDVGDVRLVFQPYGSYSYIDFAQESGRVSRCGTGGTAEIWLDEDSEVSDLLYECTRTCLARNVDGLTALKCSSNDDTCWYCMNLKPTATITETNLIAPSASPLPVQEIPSWFTKAQKYVNNVTESQTCVMCLVRRRSNTRHRLDSCCLVNKDDMKKMVKWFWSQQYVGSTACKMCLLPIKYHENHCTVEVGNVKRVLYCCLEMLKENASHSLGRVFGTDWQNVELFALENKFNKIKGLSYEGTDMNSMACLIMCATGLIPTSGVTIKGSELPVRRREERHVENVGNDNKRQRVDCNFSSRLLNAIKSIKGELNKCIYCSLNKNEYTHKLCNKLDASMFTKHLFINTKQYSNEHCYICCLPNSVCQDQSVCKGDNGIIKHVLACIFKSTVSHQLVSGRVENMPELSCGRVTTWKEWMNTGVMRNGHKCNLPKTMLFEVLHAGLGCK